MEQLNKIFSGRRTLALVLAISMVALAPVVVLVIDLFTDICKYLKNAWDWWFEPTI